MEKDKPPHPFLFFEFSILSDRGHVWLVFEKGDVFLFFVFFMLSKIIFFSIIKRYFHYFFTIQKIDYFSCFFFFFYGSEFYPTITFHQ